MTGSEETTDLDAVLRAVEDAERAVTLAKPLFTATRLNRAAETALPTYGTQPFAARADEDLQTDRLIDQVRRLTYFHSAVERSRVWRLAQWARGLVGRRW